MEGVSLIIPTLNEAENIDPLLERIHAALDPYDFVFEVVFSDGASTDTTREMIQVWQDKADVRLVENEQGKGLALAVIAGARAAVYDFVVVMDADLSHPPEVIPQLLKPLMNDRADIVVGSRYVRGGKTPDWPLRRKCMSTLATLPARLFTHIKDPLAGFIALRRERLIRIKDEVCGFKIGLELLATAEDDVRVQEVPITFRDRRWGESKLSRKVVQDYLRQLLMLVGVNLLPGGFKRLFFIFLTFMIVDSASLTALLHYGVAPGWAHWFSFISAAIFSGTVAVKSISRNDIRDVGELLNWYFIGTVCVCLMALFLRSGLVATYLRMVGDLSTEVVFYLGLLGFLFAYLGMIFWVHSRKERRIRGRQLSTYYGLGVVFYLVLLRVAYIGGLELLPEEQYYYELLNKSYQSNYTGFIPVPAFVGAVGLPNFSESIFGFRFGVWLLWFISLIFIFSLTRDMYDRQVAFALVLLFSIVPLFFATGFFVTNEAVLTFIWCAALYFLYRAVVAEVRAAWIWAGIVIGLGIQLDVRSTVLLAGVLVYLLSSTASQNLLSRFEPYMGAAAMLLTFLPTIIIKGGTLAVDVLVKEVYGGPIWVESILGNVFSSLWILPLILLTPTVLAAGIVCIWLVFRFGRNELRYEGERAERHRVFFMSVFAVPFLLFLIPDLFENNSICAAGLVWIGLMPVIAVLLAFKVEYGNPDFASHFELAKSDAEIKASYSQSLITPSAIQERIISILQRCWWPTVAIMLVIYGLGLHLLAL